MIANVYPPVQAPMAHVACYPYLYIVAAQYQQHAYQPQNQPPSQAPVFQNQQDNKNQSQGQGKCYDKKRPQHDQIHVSYTQLLPYLIQQGEIMPKEIPPVVYPYGLKYNPTSSYAFHAGYIGHST